MKLTIEVNQASEEIQRAGDKSSLSLPNGNTVSITPPVGEDFWLLRVRVSKNQAIVAFPKFGTIGIGFSKEEDWNTNLPYQCSGHKIWNHIKHNKGRGPKDADCIAAIAMLQSECHKLRNTDPVKDAI